MPLPRTGSLATVMLLLCGGGMACAKPASSSHAPAAADRTSARTDAAPAGALRYAATPAVLVQAAHIDFTATGGGQYAQATFDVRAELSVRADGSSGDGLEVAWTIRALDDLALQGSLQGQDSDDVAAYVRGLGAGVWLTDRRGAVALRRSDEHPANAGRRAALARVDAEIQQRHAAGEQDVVPPPGAALLRLVPELLALPELPAQPLLMGAPVQTTRSRQTALIGTDLVVPTDIAVRYDLVRVQNEAGLRQAEVSFQIEEWGGLVRDEGDVELHNRTEGTMLFDVDRGVPVSVGFTREESLVTGELSYDTTKIVSATFAVQ